MRRTNWNEYFGEVANLIASHSSCERLHVGCVLIRDNRILSTGYNGCLTGVPHLSRIANNHEQTTLHAEQNCIADCAKRGISTDGATAFITHFPCIHCFKLLLSAGIVGITYINDYHNERLVMELAALAKIRIVKFYSDY